jgi:16S rRNA G966 N2-methylase RsmD
LNSPPGAGEALLGDNGDPPPYRPGGVAAESVDLIYLDPPFNSNRSYNVPFAARLMRASNVDLEAAPYGVAIATSAALA